MILNIDHIKPLILLIFTDIHRESLLSIYIYHS